MKFVLNNLRITEEPKSELGKEIKKELKLRQSGYNGIKDLYEIGVLTKEDVEYFHSKIFRKKEK